VNPWWWVPIGLAAWFLVAIVASLLIGPVLRRSSQARESLHRDPEESSDERKLSEDERRAS
jgi:flagellar biosynthesis/type III secretory pathway M-ring protein FliF/YscJ